MLTHLKVSESQMSLIYYDLGVLFWSFLNLLRVGKFNCNVFFLRNLEELCILVKLEFWTQGSNSWDSTCQVWLLTSLCQIKRHGDLMSMIPANHKVEIWSILVQDQLGQIVQIVCEAPS
jgi:hypothetical protein